jgi:hypothetical protein
MIEITDGFTSICAGVNSISPSMATPRPTGARVTLEFCRVEPLASGQRVEAHYEFAGDGRLRTATGIATPTRVVVHPGSAVTFHYRLSHWIEPDAVMQFVTSNVRHRTDGQE